MQTTAAVNLEKGGRVDLTKGTGLTKIGVGLGWDLKATAGDQFDLDASVICCAAGGKILPMPDHLLFFNSPSSNNTANVKEKMILGGALLHSGDNLTGEGEGDDEFITIDFNRVPAEVHEMHILCNIFKGAERNQNFGQVNNAFARAFNVETGESLAKYDLSENYSSNTGVHVATVYRHDDNGTWAWKFRAIGEGKNGSINDIMGTYPQ